MTKHSLGNRVFYDSVTGAKLWETGEVWESYIPTQHQPIMGEVKYVDFEVKSYDSYRFFIESIDLETLQPVLKKFDWVQDELTPEEIIAQKEEELAILKANKEIGGLA